MDVERGDRSSRFRPRVEDLRVPAVGRAGLALWVSMSICLQRAGALAQWDGHAEFGLLEEAGYPLVLISVILRP